MPAELVIRNAVSTLLAAPRSMPWTVTSAVTEKLCTPEVTIAISM